MISHQFSLGLPEIKYVKKYFDDMNVCYSQNINSFFNLPKNDQMRIIECLKDLRQKTERDFLVTRIFRDRNGISVSFSCGQLFC